jgi:hypothetical protein
MALPFEFLYHIQEGMERTSIPYIVTKGVVMTTLCFISS